MARSRTRTILFAVGCLLLAAFAALPLLYLQYRHFAFHGSKSEQAAADIVNATRFCREILVVPTRFDDLIAGQERRCELLDTDTDAFYTMHAFIVNDGIELWVWGPPYEGFRNSSAFLNPAQIDVFEITEHRRRQLEEAYGPNLFGP